MALPPFPRRERIGRFRRRWSVTLLAVVGLLTLVLAPSATPRGTSAANGFAAFCSRVVKTNVGPFPPNAIVVSSGAEMVCNPPNGSTVTAAAAGSSTTASSASTTSPGGTNPGSAKNVDAANPHEDVNPSGAQAYLQSEGSIAATGPYVVEAWGDITGFASPCPSPMFKEEITGYGFSADGGKTFTDEGGLPNDCTTGFRYLADTSVEAYNVGGTAYFYIASDYVNFTTGQSDIALDACTASGTTLTCPPQPTIVATGGPGDFLDKSFMTVDPQRARLYVSYVRFGAEHTPTFFGQIELAECAISVPAAPKCNPGASPAPYLVVAPGDANCTNNGPYPAVSIAKGDVYVAWEFNYFTNFSNPACQGVPTQNKVAYVPFACLTDTPTSPCAAPTNEKMVNIISMDAAVVPGYNRFPMNDWPRIAVSDPYNTVTIVWNDARVHTLGDIFMQSYTQVALTPVQPAPVPLNSLSKGGAHFLPALRNPSQSGKLNVSWYQRADPNSTLTDVYLNSNIVPTDPNPAQTNYRVTNTTTDWSAVSADGIPNFGDYTDNYVLATPTPPYTNHVLYIAWTDGRLGLPQPFEANVSVS